MITFFIPKLLDLVQRARSAFVAELPGTDAWIWPNNVGPIAKVIGGAVSEVFGRLDYVRKQAFASTADGQWLELHGSEYNITRKPALTGGGSIVVTSPAGLTIPAGTTLTRSDNVAYVTSVDAALSAAGTVSIPVIALAAGKTSNAVAGTPLTIGAGPTGPGVGLATAAVDASGISGGADVEKDGPLYTSDLATLRGRILFRKRNPPAAGAPPDYVRWCTAVPGVTRVFVERLYAGPGTVRIFCLFDDLFASAGGVADAAHIATVQAALAPDVPASAGAVFTAPAPMVIPVTIAHLLPMTTPVETAIAAELLDTFRRLGAVAGNDTPVSALPYLAVPTTFSLSWIWQAIANATGEQRHQLVSPAADITIPAGSIPVLGPITYV